MFSGLQVAPRPIKVLLADDHPLMVATLRRTREGQAGIEVVGQAQTAEEVLALAERRRPDIVLTDLRMPGAEEFGLISTLRARHPAIKIVVFSASDDCSSVQGAMMAGASAFIVKSAAPTDMVSILRQVHGNVPSLRAVPTAHEQECCLTDRERTILSAVASGKPTAAISRELWISDQTISFHLANICRKVGAPNRADAVRYAVEHGLVA
jgi:DNA-binding NarL/FixJ family response regulator